MGSIGNTNAKKAPDALALTPFIRYIIVIDTRSRFLATYSPGGANPCGHCQKGSRRPPQFGSCSRRIYARPPSTISLVRKIEPPLRRLIQRMLPGLSFYIPNMAVTSMRKAVVRTTHSNHVMSHPHEYAVEKDLADPSQISKDVERSLYYYPTGIHREEQMKTSS